MICRNSFALIVTDEAEMICLWGKALRGDMAETVRPWPR